MGRSRPFTTTYACPTPGPHPFAVPPLKIKESPLAVLGGLIIGIKEWKLVPPEYADELKDPRTETVPKTLDSESAQFPHLARAREKAISVWQYPGETIFVPSGWYHQVTNHGFPHPTFVKLTVERHYLSTIIGSTSHVSRECTLPSNTNTRFRARRLRI